MTFSTADATMYLQGKENNLTRKGKVKGMMTATRRAATGLDIVKEVSINNNEELKAFIESETDFIQSNRGHYFTEICDEDGILVKKIAYNNGMRYIVKVSSHRVSKAY